MRLIVAEDYDDLSRKGADLVTSVVSSKPDAAAVLATGETPVGLYRELQARRKDGTIDLSRLRVFQLDEYLGLAPNDPRLFYGWMKQEFIGPLGVPEANVMQLPSDPPTRKSPAGNTRRRSVQPVASTLRYLASAQTVTWASTSHLPTQTHLLEL